MYYCELCDYKTEDRNKIHYHHIIPKELTGSDLPKNRCYLCPNHHSLIYIPESNNGIHSIKTKDSIIIKGWLQSSCGKVLVTLNELLEENYSLSKNF